MIGVVIVAHGGLAKEFRAALEHVVGAQEQLESLPIGPDDDVEARRMVLAGINLPMLIKLASVRADVPLPEAVNAAKEAGRKYISVASQVLSGEA
jgi:PTS system mannose-specific IIA component